jgi:hypothetical protein
MVPFSRHQVKKDSAVNGAGSADNIDLVVKSANTLPGATKLIQESKYCSFEGQADSLLSSIVIWLGMPVKCFSPWQVPIKCGVHRGCRLFPLPLPETRNQGLSMLFKNRFEIFHKRNIQYCVLRSIDVEAEVCDNNVRGSRQCRGAGEMTTRLCNMGDDSINPTVLL